ncbi:hypothetical protein VNO78_34921 [Psophocarpus tetragonolobus]|uniref:Uncharacterized protein n=1 Tax=Psophocarpus tetragonolobus TaxID=3891 RepID=A0AAN9RLI0_PSOTE
MGGVEVNFGIRSMVVLNSLHERVISDVLENLEVCSSSIDEEGHSHASISYEHRLDATTLPLVGAYGILSLELLEVITPALPLFGAQGITSLEPHVFTPTTFLVSAQGITHLELLEAHAITPLVSLGGTVIP